MVFARRTTLWRIGCIGLVGTSALACASTRVSPRLEQVEPDFLEDDERELWEGSALLDEQLERSGALYSDPRLQETLEAVTERLLGAMDADELPVRVHVLIDPTLNAFALPNGSLYLHSGLLVRIRNEAQLAALLGHELTHCIERHALRSARTERNKQTAAMTVLGVLAVAVAGATANPDAAMMLLELGSQVSGSLIAAQVAGYGRDLEREADRRGIASAAAGGWSPEEAVKLYRVLLDETEPHDDTQPYVYASHPYLEERIRDSREQAATLPPGDARVAEAEYMEAVRPLVLVDAEHLLRRGRPMRARTVVERHAAWWADDAELHGLLARLRERTAVGRSGLDEAVVALETALAAAPDDPALVRRLGLLQRTRGDLPTARSALERYLALSPDAPDRLIVEGILSELRMSDGTTP